MDDFFAGWFVEFSKGLDKLNNGECGRLFTYCLYDFRLFLLKQDGTINFRF